jgi:hypothetical protein
MTAVILLLLAETWPVVYGDALVERFHSYDLLAVHAEVEPRADGLLVDCRLRLRVERPGPLRFLLARDIADLSATMGEDAVDAALGAGGFEQAVRVLAPEARGIPSLLTLRAPRPLRAGETVEVRLRYRWRGGAGGWAYVGEDRLQTHLSSFWLPTMAHELFDAVVEIPARMEAVGPGRRTRVDGRWRFESTHPVQVVSLVAGAFDVHARQAGKRRLEVLVPSGADVQPEALLDDLAAVVGKLDEWFDPAGPPLFRLVVEPSPRPAPSYCADSFAVVHRSALALPRERWLAHLAHECSHLWWGHRVPTPVIGRGGTWLREGLAQWSGIEVAGALLGPDAARELWRANFRGYLRRIDLRRRGDFLFANEATLRDATYLDDPVVPYLRGALVFRRMAHELGAERFREALRSGEYCPVAHRFTDIGNMRPLAPDLVAYYAETTRLPDLELADVRTGPGRAEGVVRCRDPRWPGGRVPVRIETETGTVWVDAEDGRFAWTGEGEPRRIEIDPERIQLDPIRSNNVWVAKR